MAIPSPIDFEVGTLVLVDFWDHTAGTGAYKGLSLCRCLGAIDENTTDDTLILRTWWGVDRDGHNDDYGDDDTEYFAIIPAAIHRIEILRKGR